MIKRRKLLACAATSLLNHFNAQAALPCEADRWNVFLQGGVTPAPANERLVAVSYSVWFYDKRAAWRNEWGVPELGYYASNDASVIRQHGLWLSQAGVDFVLLDLSNDFGADWLCRTGDEKSLARLTATESLFNVWSSMPHAPKISILLGGNPPDVFNNGRLKRKIDEINKLFLTKKEYAHLIQTYLAKPLLVIFIGPTATGQYAGKAVAGGWPNGVPAWEDARFTVRFMGGFITDQPNLINSGNVSKYGYWSWENRGAPSFTLYDNHPEAMTIVAAWDGKTKLHAPQGRMHGNTFKQEWAYARRIGPRIALVTTFNEWWRGEQHNAEFSRDIEPSRAYGEFYLETLKQQAGLFKQGY